MELIDISKEFFSAKLYDGDPEPKIRQLSSVPNGDCNLSFIEACLHTSTHVDAPFHYFNDGMDVSQIPLSSFIGDCYVADIGQPPLTGSEIGRYIPFDCERILLKSSSGNSFLHPSAASELGLNNMVLVGTDSVSIGGGLFDDEVHKALLTYNVAILENLELSHVLPGRYFLFAPPVKIGGADGAPCRAVLLKH